MNIIRIRGMGNLVADAPLPPHAVFSFTVSISMVYAYGKDNAVHLINFLTKTTMKWLNNNCRRTQFDVKTLRKSKLIHFKLLHDAQRQQSRNADEDEEKKKK